MQKITNEERAQIMKEYFTEEERTFLRMAMASIYTKCEDEMADDPTLNEEEISSYEKTLDMANRLFDSFVAE